MAAQNISAAQLAGYALACIDKVQISADEQTLAVTQATRQLLRGIADGTFIVQQAVQPAPPALSGGPAAQSDGVIPASVSGAPQT